MIGQGRPSSLSHALARSALLLCAFLASSASAQEIAPANKPVRLHITWGGGEASQWTGKIGVDKGALSDLKLLGTEADAAGSVWLDHAQLQISALAPHKSDSVELAANATPDAKLLIELMSGPKATPTQAQVPLADLQRQPYQLALDGGNTLEIRAVPIPALHIAIKGDAPSRDTLIFAPGDQLSFELAPTIPPALHGTTLDVQTTLSRARSTKVLWRDNQRLAVPVDGQAKIDLSVPLQQPEGVYTVHVTVSRPSGYFRDKFLPGAAAPLAERSFQIVLLDAHPPIPEVNERWESVLEIDPTNPRWVERLPSWTQVRFIPGLNRMAMGSMRADVVDLALGRFVALRPTTTGGDPHWQAYSLPLEAGGTPHVLEIDYPADAEQHFGLSIVEPNSVGVIAGNQRDAGVYVEGLGRSEAKQKQTHRLVFWPRTQAPLLVVTNQHPTAVAHFGQIRVLKRTGPLAAHAPGPPVNGRLISAYLARPLAAETFGATEAGEASDAGTPKSVADLQTSYEAATRLAEYVRYGGYNSAVVSVMADGSAIFPQPQMLFTPRYNTGRTLDRPHESDGLELMLSVFDREHLALVPAIEFTTPIPQLEELRRANNPQVHGLELVGPDGRTWLEANGSRNGLAPYYNLLEPHVQQVMLNVVGELVKRYGKHPAFGGMAIQLSSDGYAQLPGLEWGLDDATVERFQRATGLQLNATGSNRFATRLAALTGPYADAWRLWRAAQVADFYRRLAVIVANKSDHRLVLTTEKLFDHPQAGLQIRPNLMKENRVAAAMLEMGLDRTLLGKVPGVVLCPTRYVEPMAPLPERATDLELNEAFAHGQPPPDSRGQGAVVLYHRPLHSLLASLARYSSSLKLADEMRITSQPLASGAAAREPYLQALVERDPTMLIDGGDLLPLGQEEMLRTVRAVFAELPNSAPTSEIAKQPVTVRSYVEPHQVTFLVMNMSPWQADAQVTLDLPQASKLEPLAAPKADAVPQIKALLLAAGRQPWNVSLGPYDLRAVRVAVPGAKAVDVQVKLNAAVNAELVKRLADLSNRDLSAPRDYQALTNPGFESLNGGAEPVGWHKSANATNATIGLDPTLPHEGKSSLYLRNAGAIAAVESDPFAVPATGQLAMTVFARGRNLGPNTELKLVFETEQNGQLRGFPATARLQNPAAGTDPQWGCFVLTRPDLPLETGRKMRIIFELTGPGELWLDDVKLNDLLFTLKFYPDNQREILRLVKRQGEVQSAFDAGQISECVQLLDGYWPRFIMAYTPPVAPKIALAPSTNTTTPPSATTDPSTTPSTQETPAPSVGDRLKRFVPIFK